MEDDVSREDVEKGSILLRKLQDDLERIKMEHNGQVTSRRGLLDRQKEISRTFPEFEGKVISDVRRSVEDLGKKQILMEERGRKEVELSRERDRISNELESLSRNEVPLGENIGKLKLEMKGLSSTLDERISTFKGLEIDLEAKDPALKLETTISELKEKDSRLSIEIGEWTERIEGMNGKLIELNEKLRSGKENLERTLRRLEEANKSIGARLEKLDQEGLRSIEDLGKALLDESREMELSRKVEAFSKERIQVQNSIETLGKSIEELGVAAPTQEELLEVEGREDKAKSEWQEVTERRANADSDLKWTKQQLDKVQKASRGIEEMEKTMKVVGRLSMQVKGLGNPRMSLERFFLAQRFEEVLISSNHRLKVLSGNRFLLRRADEAEMGKRAKVGLDLNVYDNYTGQERPANTLSGGQMFLSSLALALGLADVVQSRSGGIRMDALFIDEGFGSLDDETLQTALKVLSELREGRMVGVISHVGELKRQIRSGFEVVPSPTGSVVRRI